MIYRIVGRSFNLTVEGGESGKLKPTPMYMTFYNARVLNCQFFGICHACQLEACHSLSIHCILAPGDEATLKQAVNFHLGKLRAL